MDEILGQLGGLLLGSVPTVIFMVLLYGLYAAMVHKPLVKVLAERHSRTEGAVGADRRIRAASAGSPGGTVQASGGTTSESASGAGRCRRSSSSKGPRAA